MSILAIHLPNTYNIPLVRQTASNGVQEKLLPALSSTLNGNKKTALNTCYTLVVLRYLMTHTEFQYSLISPIP